MPDIEALAKEFQGRAVVVKLDLTRFFNKTVQAEFGITSLPTYLVYRDGQEVARLSGPEQANVPAVREALTAALAPEAAPETDAP